MDQDNSISLILDRAINPEQCHRAHTVFFRYNRKINKTKFKRLAVNERSGKVILIYIGKING